MNIRQLELENFKRFTDLTIDLSGCDKPPRLVLLIGANGSGKSSIFDAFEYFSTMLKGEKPGQHDKQGKPFSGSQNAERSIASANLENYYTKESPFSALMHFTRAGQDQTIFIPGNIQREFSSANNSFYGRSAHRSTPVINLASKVVEDLQSDEDRPRRYIDHDERFTVDVDLIFRRFTTEIFAGGDGTFDELLEKFINPFNRSFRRVFGEQNGATLRLASVLPSGVPGTPPEINFRKGVSELPYYLLSSGEKEVFNTLLNFFIRRDEFKETIYFIDELDAHLHTALQYNLIRDIVEHWLPENCQLWTASHSLGFIEYAEAAKDAVIIDFDELDFDQPQVLEPADRKAAIFEVAVPSGSSLRVFPNREIVLCENQDIGFYSRVEQDDFVFAKSQDKGTVIHHVSTSDEFLGLIDGDFLTAAEKQKAMAKHPQLRILPYYSIESLLYHPANLAEVLPEDFSREAYESKILEVKTDIETTVTVRLRDSRRNYYLIKEWGKDEKSEAADQVAKSIKSKAFDTYYPFLDMKNHRPKTYLGPFNLNPSDLARTDFFRDQLLQALRPAPPAKG